MAKWTHVAALSDAVAAFAFSVCLLVSGPLIAAANSEAQSPSRHQPGPAGSDAMSSARISSQSVSLPMRASMIMDAQIKDLRLKLNMIPRQQTLFDAVARAMRKNADEMGGLIAHALIKQPRDAVEVVKSASQFINVQSEGIREILPPLEAFYASLSEEQKRSLDKAFSNLFGVEDP